MISPLREGRGLFAYIERRSSKIRIDGLTIEILNLVSIGIVKLDLICLGSTNVK